MRLFLAVCCAFMAGVVPALSQTVVVRSGAHADFTRLTFALPPGAAWRLQEVGPLPRVLVSGVDPDFDISTVFQRIDRARLRALRVDGAAVELDLSCDCVLRAFDAGPNLVAIDIGDALPLPGSEQAGGDPAVADPVPTIRPKSAPWPRPSGGDTRAVRTPVSAGDALFPGQTLLPAMQIGAPDAEAPDAARVALARDALVVQIGRAATSGMIETVRPVLPPTADVPVAEALSPPVVATTAVNLSAMTAIDAAIASRGAPVRAPSGSGCLPDEVVALHDWAGSRDFASEVSDRRARLYGEFDQINVDEGIALARVYLHYGFGREVQQLLTLLPENAEAVPVLADLALLIEGMPPQGALSDQVACDGDVALWAMLAEDGSGSGLIPAVPAVERAFLRLPEGLQTLLGERVASGLRQAGAEDAAERTLRRTLRSAPRDAPQALGVQANLAEVRGSGPEAETAMLMLARAEADGSPGAVVSLADRHWADRRSPAPDIVDLAASFATEMRRTDMGADLRLAHMRLRALSSDFDAAADALREIEARDGVGAAQRAHSDLLAELARSGGDADLLRLAITAPMPVVSGLPDAVSNRVAERLLDLGFPEEADRFLQAPARTADGEARLRLRVRAALEQDNLARAEVHLSAATGPEADRLRAEILLRQGRPDAAADLLRQTDGDAAERLDWIAGRTRDVGLAGDPSSSYLPLDVPSPVAGASGLAAATDSVDRSQVVRDRVAELLARHAGPPG